VSEERSQNEQLMNYEEVKLNFLQNILLTFRVYFRVIPMKFQFVFFVPFILCGLCGQACDSNHVRIAWFNWALGAIAGVLSNLIVFGLAPMVWQELLKDALFPYIKEHLEEEKIKIQKASLKQIDDILLKK